MIRCLAILVALGLFGSAARGDPPKNYRITLFSVSKVGDAEFQPGEYKLTLDASESKISLTDRDNGTTVELAGKVHGVDAKFPQTQIHSRLVDGRNQISEIRIGGSKTKVVFD
jgi:hypothetical protein